MDSHSNSRLQRSTGAEADSRQMVPLYWDLVDPYYLKKLRETRQQVFHGQCSVTQVLILFSTAF